MENNSMENGNGTINSDGVPQHWLTKSLFTHALGCPTKAYYKQNHQTYQSTEDENGFLQALAEGGIQVGELAQHYFPGGHLIEYSRDKAKSIDDTNALLEQDSVTIFEAAIAHENCYSLVDVFVKEGNVIKLIEVKSKSWTSDVSMIGSNGKIGAKLQKYLYDIAFQTWIAKKAFPNHVIEPYLMLIDKNKAVTVDGLHQNFEIYQDENGRSQLRLTVPSEQLNLGEPILKQIDVSEEVGLIFAGKGRKPASDLEAKGFDEWIMGLASLVAKNEKYPTQISSSCKNCEHRVKASDLKEGKACGFNECWAQALNWGEEEFAKPHAFDMWNHRAEKLLKKEIYTMDEITPDSLGVDEATLYDQSVWRKGKGEKGTSQRQLAQVMKMTGRHDDSEVVLPGLFHEMETWTYPLHFIDFEGVAPAIPFHKGMKPYKKTPFQFSVHDVDAEGKVTHVAEWVEKERGKFPCFDFIRELKKVLDGDEGTVFMYHHYERTTLRDVKNMLLQSTEQDKDELIEFIDTLISEESPRYMVDLQALVVQYYYSVYMKGSNSIKYVLPAILNESAFLKEEYSKPYSGRSIQDKVLYVEQNGITVNPYTLLDPLGLRDVPDDVDEIAGDFDTKLGETIADGGKAMMAWSRMQFDDVPEEERELTFKGLLRYCELDTLAMVMIYQHWKSLSEQ